MPIKATLGYLLSVGAAFGAVVAVFQWGWFADLLNVHHAGPVLSFMPIILMGVLFGLAMDYEVFLLSRVREEWDRTGDSHESVANGLAATARHPDKAARLAAHGIAAIDLSAADADARLAAALAERSSGETDAACTLFREET